LGGYAYACPNIYKLITSSGLSKVGGRGGEKWKICDMNNLSTRAIGLIICPFTSTANYSTSPS
jgi:hypothetical protein